jgi:hypothetical protein
MDARDEVPPRRVRCGPRHVERQLLRFDQLELKRTSNPRGVAVVPASEALAALDRR